MIRKYTSSSFNKFSFLFFVMMAVFLSNCDKDDSVDQCFDNRTDEPIDIYIDGVYDFTIDEDTQDCLFFGDGCFDWYAEGVLSGYYLEGTFCVGAGNFSSTIVIDD